VATAFGAALLLVAIVLGAADAWAQAGAPLAVDILSCEPQVAGGALLKAQVAVRTGDTGARILNLQCGAYEEGTDRVLFLNGVDGVDRVPPNTIKVVTAYFPADARHTICRCVVGEVRRLEQEEVLGTEIDFGVPDPEAPVPPPDELQATREWDDGRAVLDLLGEGEEPRPAADPPGRRLRYEIVLVPNAPLREAPGAETPVIGRLRAGERVALHGVRAGYKWVLTDAGLGGWTRGDAVTSDEAVPQRVSEALAPLRVLAAPGETLEGDTGALCRAVDRDDLDELVFAMLPESRAAYVQPVWYALDTNDQDAFQLWAAQCYGVTRILDVARGLELRNVAWQTRPALSSAPGGPGPEAP